MLFSLHKNLSLGLGAWMRERERERERAKGAEEKSESERERGRESGIGDVGLRSFGLLFPNNLEPSPVWHPCKWFIYQLFVGCHFRFLPSLGTLEVTVL
jgi:hypothetical protein